MSEEQVRGIIRIAGKDMPGQKPLVNALCGIKGVGIRFARNVAYQFQKETNTPYNSKVGSLTKEQLTQIEEILTKSKDHRLPTWSLNSQKEFETGEDKQLIMAELQLNKRVTLKRLADMKSYRGLRLQWGLTVRGQHTRSTGRKAGKKARYKSKKKIKKQ
ncbi:MAG: 30S ribosomal protein S13 [Candidatus Diapherotrites archaeon]|nr:30S ribosomal protein S13 [Candidatus Diapherotrites archaeon]